MVAVFVHTAAVIDSQTVIECLPHLNSTPLLHGSLSSEYCHNVWCRKTRMAWLWYGGKILKIRLFVLTESTIWRQRDGQTNRRTDTA